MPSMWQDGTQKQGADADVYDDLQGLLQEDERIGN